MLDLLINSLRMRPDRIILGEMRKRKEAEVAFEAMHTGHSVYATIHGDDMQQTIRRLVNEPMNISSSLLDAVGLNVVMFRDRRKGYRRVFQVGEFIINSNGSFAVPNILYQWDPKTDSFRQKNKPKKIFRELSLMTGMSQKDILHDLGGKKKLLELMAKHNIRALRDIGNIFSAYYNSVQEAFDLVRGYGRK